MPLSPMMQQYMLTKEKYKDCLLFYRLGDFYEMFFDDAVTASKVLELTLTGRDCGLEERAPMCGVPYHAGETYIQKLIDQNFKVAICEQLTLPEESRNLVERDVVRVVTPGTVMDSVMLKEDSNNYITSLFGCESGVGLAYADLSTGDFYVTEFKGKDAIKAVEDCLIKLSPSEVICNENIEKKSHLFSSIQYQLLPKFNVYFDWAYHYETAYKTVKAKLNVNNLNAFLCEGKKLAISAAGGLLEYFTETQKRALTHINRIQYISSSEHMLLDSNTFRNLELVRTMRDGKKTGSLLGLLDITKTHMGARFLLNAFENPLNNQSEIQSRLDAVEELVKGLIIRENLTNFLKKIHDIERLIGKISYGNVTPKDLVSLQESLVELPKVKGQLKDCTSALLTELNTHISEESELTDLFTRALQDNPPNILRDGGFIREGFSKELDEYRYLSQNAKQWMSDFETRERENTGIKAIKVHYNRVFGYYIEVGKSYLDQVPSHYVRRQTTANAERYITPELKEMESKLLSADELSVKLELQLFGEIVERCKPRIQALQQTAKSIAYVDMLVAFATIAMKHKYCKPTINPYGGATILREGRHPVVEAFLKAGGQFVSNDTFLDGHDRTMIITGPNMAGKSTYMRQVALITFMAHVGSFVPCKQAEIALTDRIFTRVGASDNLLFDQSTFMVEMTEVATILNSATSNSLLILDEVGRGTSTFDGLSIAWAVMEHVCKNIQAKTLFATHYHELTELEGTLEGAKNYRITVKELPTGIVFLRKIERGGANKSFGIEVAALAGLPRSVIVRSKAILKQLEEADINNPRSKSAQFQLDLDHLDEPNEPVKSEVLAVLSEIETLDVLHMTPLDALTYLMELSEKVKKLN